MPAILTHYSFIEKYLGAEEKNNPYFPLMVLASQGPDVFFYRKGKAGKQINQFGSLLHHIDISDCYFFLINYAQGVIKSRQEIYYSFIKGLLIHYIVDRNCHPYIFYKTLYDFNLHDKKQYFLSHAYFESNLDADIKNTLHLINNPLKALKVKKEYVKAVSPMFKSMAKEVLKINYIDDDTYYKSWKDMKLLYRLLNSKSGFKRWLFKVSNIKHGLAFVMSTPVKSFKTKEIDYLNTSHEKWLNPVSGEEFNLSVIEMLDNAAREISEIDRILNLAKNDLPFEMDLKRFVDNIDHDGSLVNAKKTYYECCFLKTPNIVRDRFLKAK